MIYQIDNTIQFLLCLISSKKLLNQNMNFTISPHKCYNLWTITPAIIDTLYVGCIYGVQSDTKRFHNKFRLVLEIDC